MKNRFGDYVNIRPYEYLRKYEYLIKIVCFEPKYTLHNFNKYYLIKLI